ncbi:hypothetical protein [Romboutsia timonensis]|uniref:hypothetical protein n=1 Tax=Romboutsia timonensis TaxID=1776391 RepID=UPI002A82D30D|nr:hypothetical protein [Romboutsia timonensis]MDY3960853.1 hypothetical protein [Romboutsia timonensis]
MKTKKFKNNIDNIQIMIYNEDNDVYICYNNRKLNLVGTSTRKSKPDYVANIKLYECESCNDFQMKFKCTKAKGNKKI